MSEYSQPSALFIAAMSVGCGVLMAIGTFFISLELHPSVKRMYFVFGTLAGASGGAFVAFRGFTEAMITFCVLILLVMFAIGNAKLENPT